MRRLISFLVLIFWPALVHAAGIEPQLVAEMPARAGSDVELAIHMRPAKGWHGYWLNPGEAGLPMDVQWHLPKGFEVGELRYPVPTRLTVAGLVNYVFDKDYAVLARLRVPVEARGSVPIRADARWLACTDKICVPEQGKLALDLPLGGGKSNRSQFDAWRAMLPKPLATLGHFAVEHGKLELAVPLPAGLLIRDPYVFPLADKIVDLEAPQSFRRNGDWVIAELAPKNVPAAFGGVLAVGDGRGFEFQAVPGPVPAGGSRIGGVDWVTMSLAVLGAIAGGILLNLMPCVFPILGLKTLHISRAGGDATEARSDAIGYAAGAILGTGLLGGLLLAIRAAGTEAGWAFQLQDPRTIMLLLLLAIAITANLLALFELPVLGARMQPASSFGTGALAAFVATPCAGPFLGAALGTALLLPAIGSVAVFAALGLGLALPFVLLAFIPALRARLPRPGPWMERLKRFLAIPMAASAVAALWLLYRQAGDRGLVIGITVSVGLLFALFEIGRLQRRGRGGAWGGAIAAVALVVVGVSMVPQREVRQTAGGGAEPWSEARVADYLAQRKPVFVYFTADWCLTCKVNEAAAIDRRDVAEAFRRKRVKVLEGDWTSGDATITRFLENHGRAGVPYYLWYVPGRPPEELPQVLTASMLIARSNAVRT